MTKKCLYCGKEFEDNRSKNKVYCCKDCKTKASNSKRQRLPVITKNCLFCGNEFISRNKGRENKYCCRACSRKHYKILNHDRLLVQANKRRNTVKVDKPEWIFNNIKRSCKYRNLSFNISYEYFLEHFWHIPCSYCGSEINTAGIDRLDSSLGYEIDNCVPCCTKCNMMKQAHSPSDFLSHIQKIIAFQGLG